MLHMIGHAIFGLVIGLLARAIMPGRQHMGLILTMILGLVGAWLGGLIGRILGLYPEGHPAGFLMALVGALILLFAVGMVMGPVGMVMGPPGIELLTQAILFA